MIIAQQASIKNMKIKSYHNIDKYKNQLQFKDKLYYLKSTVDVEYLLSSLGFNITHDSYKELRSDCKIHGGDNKTAFRFNKQTRTWACFTHKCHEQYGSDIVGLIRAVTGKDFLGAIEYLRQLVGHVGDSVDYVELKRKREMTVFMNSYNSLNLRPKSVNDKSLMYFKPLRSGFFLYHGFSKETLDLFEVAGGWKDLNNIQRDIIPIRDENGVLVAYSLRDIRKHVSEDDKYILTPGFDKQNCLYNLFRAQQYGETLPLIVVEGFKSVWRLHDYGIDNVVATMGSSLTEGQQLLLCKYAQKGVVLLFDNDMAGITATVKAYNDMSKKLEVKPVFIQDVDSEGKGLDPADLTKEQLYEYLYSYF